MGIDKATLEFTTYHIEHRSCCWLDQRPLCLGHDSQHLQRHLSHVYFGTVDGFQELQTIVKSVGCYLRL